MSSYQMSGNRPGGPISDSSGFDLLGFDGPGSDGFCDNYIIASTLIGIS